MLKYLALLAFLLTGRSTLISGASKPNGPDEAFYAGECKTECTPYQLWQDPIRCPGGKCCYNQDGHNLGAMMAFDDQFDGWTYCDIAPMREGWKKIRLPDLIAPMCPNSADVRFILHTSEDDLEGTEYRWKDIPDQIFSPGNDYIHLVAHQYLDQKIVNKDMLWMKKTCTTLIAATEGRRSFCLGVYWGSNFDVSPDLKTEAYRLLEAPNGANNVLTRSYDALRIVSRVITYWLSRLKGVDTDRGQMCQLVHQMNCVGHGLGAHACGQMGTWIRLLYNCTLAKVTGVDPMGPQYERKLFLPQMEVVQPICRLDRSSADCVSVLHTSYSLEGRSLGGVAGDISGLGMYSPIGHLDFIVDCFYPSVCRCPDCKLNDMILVGEISKISPWTKPLMICSHATPMVLHYEAMNPNTTCKYRGVSCGTADCQKFQKGQCDMRQIETFDINTCAKPYPANEPPRILHLSTSSKEPYCQIDTAKYCGNC